ncbi:T-cell antigen CD7 isoform X4 [Choloepus didactylus]|uniref:T-cell antigen CD7 isoform X4 n=1 Tax=Choloepus didactylus TaxID=27675 RepID=UPI00189DA95E|nr:T-cell antigen CD7 isoform X4 [Choloepus didactylus]
MLRTLLLLLATLLRAHSGQVQQSPRYTVTPEGGSVSITCCSRGPLSGVYLVRSEPGSMNVIYYEDGKEPTVDKAFWARVKFSGSQQNLTVTLLHLRPADTGTYTCQAIMEDSVSGPGTHILVTEKLAQDACVCQYAGETGFALPATLAVGSFLAGLGLGVLCALRGAQIKKLLSGRTASSAPVIYEDMSCSRPCAPAVPNHYL